MRKIGSTKLFFSETGLSTCHKPLAHNPNLRSDIGNCETTYFDILIVPFVQSTAVIHYRRKVRYTMTTNEKALQMHEQWSGKLETVSKSPVKSREDLAIAYTPGVAEPCKVIAKDK